jgi:hypothetical protein
MIGRRQPRFAVMVAAFAVALGVLTSSGPASAAASDSESAGILSHGPVRMWEDRDFTGSMYINYYPGQAPGNRVDIDWWNGDNEITSLDNDTDYWVILWDNDNYTGTRKCIRPHEYVLSLHWISFDNRAESFQLSTSSMC